MSESVYVIAVYGSQSDRLFQRNKHIFFRILFHDYSFSSFFFFSVSTSLLKIEYLQYSEFVIILVCLKSLLNIIDRNKLIVILNVSARMCRQDIDNVAEVLENANYNNYNNIKLSP